ncbi:phosphoenolpyruvate synthase [Vibrio navarrensis]
MEHFVQGSIHPALSLNFVLPQSAEKKGSKRIYFSTSAWYRSQNLSANEWVSWLQSRLADETEGPQSVRVSLSDLTLPEYASLGMVQADAMEANPLMGARGVSRFCDANYKPIFAIECDAIKQLRAQGVDVEVVVPFVRTLADAATIIDLLAEQGLPRGLQGLKVIFSIDTPSAALLSDKLLHYFDGLAINIENLAQFTLAVDQSNPSHLHAYDAQNDAVLELVQKSVKSAATVNKPALILLSNLDKWPRLQQALLDMDSVELFHF